MSHFCVILQYLFLINPFTAWKLVRIRIFPAPHIPAFGMTNDQKNSKYGNISRNDLFRQSLSIPPVNIKNQIRYFHQEFLQ